MGVVREWIEGNVVKLSELMASYCPEWKSCEDTLLENPSVVDALLNNKSYNNIGPSKTKLNEWLDSARVAVRRVTSRSGPLFYTMPRPSWLTLSGRFALHTR